ncbi:MAG: hypothetical protein BWX87_02402 [Bacteroidetes bacterium ADurb.Bin123]|nr:MAG: hypothetical protein BWX87_02402 [Bacteroidetes bacterium ADurb.Bin123]
MDGRAEMLGGHLGGLLTGEAGHFHLNAEALILHVHALSPSARLSEQRRLILWRLNHEVVPFVAALVETHAALGVAD